MAQVVSIIDYGMGNLRSVANAIGSLGAAHQIISRPEEVLLADRLILPGVGAFGACMETLNRSGLIEAMHERVVEQGIPLMGICLGMQVLASWGEEEGVHQGLGWIPASVKRFDLDQIYKVPHMGWNEITHSRHELWRAVEDTHMYFVHSYHMVCENPDHVFATCDYGGIFTAAVLKENVFGTQFHPEKSHTGGLKILGNFLTWNP